MRKVAVLLVLFLLAGAGFSEAQYLLTDLIAGQTIEVGTVEVWNAPYDLRIRVELAGGWLISEIQVYVGEDPPPTTGSGNPVLGKFPYKQSYESPTDQAKLILDLSELPDAGIFNMAVHCDLVILNELGEVIAAESAWAFGPNEFGGSQWGWWFEYLLQLPS